MKKIKIQEQEQDLMEIDITINEQFFLKQYARNIDKILRIIKKDIFHEVCKREIKKYETQK